ncbi:hypothetical protein ABOM_001773 [Aspergillus bombycis]|uniref:non-specific serine/threonine protein kinase n=1 Tax=Aspergillus bombycis TaxID=109264 RepID=A0A1F8ACX6_9EURO|nr:hypothetical protein ABOM_001773 [Aspergillus bombycis]OGM49590.1 hypothetical protein ABOM_001773 [Aspergillus bombycis]
MEPSTVKYNFVEEVERLDYYVPGGYHPVVLGDQLSAGRYVIAHKLGFGRSATTWLAEDRRQNRLVALKISTAESANRMHEVQILSQLAKAKSDLPGKAIGIAHGDLHLGNILLRLPFDMQDMTPEKLYASTGKPEKEQVIREDGAPLDPGVPSELIVPVWLGLGSDEISLVDSGIMIADFGEAFHPQVTRRFAAHTPLLLAPPESRFAGLGEPDDPLSFPGDIWTLACTIWDIFGDRPPFEAFPATLDEVTIEHVEMLGRLPERWWSKWEERSNWFNEDGCKDVTESLRQWYSSSARDWNQRFTDSIQDPRERKKFDTFSEEERDAFHNMIKSMLVLEPSERATIEEVVGCKWMQRWGLPEVQKMQHAVLKSS